MFVCRKMMSLNSINMSHGVKYNIQDTTVEYNHTNMSSFAFVLLCIQACLLQNVFGQCYGPGPYGAYDGFGYGYGAYGAIAEPFAAAPFAAAPFAAGPFAAGPFAAGPCGAYGGAGIGEVAVAGELPVAGTTLVAGQVPILGAVEFGGPVCAGGTVSIAGSCACGCAGPYGAGPYGAGYIY
ncbi:chorion class A protein Ld12-like [Epargyreus clarus]|uniref:chorion class A protein Ld12-like n=1 Tax=Epargyreus clarus TaxID=520877 RepID=UPI003C2E7DAE